MNWLINLGNQEQDDVQYAAEEVNFSEFESNKGVLKHEEEFYGEKREVHSSFVNILWKKIL